MKINRYYIIFGFIFLQFFVNELFAQSFANSWINYNQSYYKMKITQNGIYRITYADLVSAGIPVSSISPQNYQIFGRGQEQYIYIYNQLTGVMSSGDYIEFYAQKNDGWYDSAIYLNPANQPNKGYSLFNDTATYYLTWNTSFSNKRLLSSTDIGFSGYTAEPYVWKNLFTEYHNEYMEGIPLKETTEETIWDPEYVDGEGYYGSAFYLGGTKIYTIPTKNAYTSGNAEISLLFLGASNFRSVINDHHVRIVFAGLQIDTVFEGYKVIKINKTVPVTSLGSVNTSFTFSSINDLGSGADRNAVAFIQVNYPHTTDFEGKTFFQFSINNATAGKTYLNISNFNGGTTPVLYDLDNHKRITVVKNGTNYQALVPNGTGLKNCFLAGQSSIISGVSLQPVGINAKFKNYLALNPNADYILISHSSLFDNTSSLSDVNDYAAYRNSTGFQVMVLNINDLYDQYSYGISKNPLAIRNFIKTAYHLLSNPPKQLFIIGKAYYPQDVRQDPATYELSLVPSFGSPPSDVLLTSHISDNTYKPAVSTGRLAAKNLDHIDLYLNKVAIYEDLNVNPPALWKKKALFFSGGDGSIQPILANYMKNYEHIYEDTSFGGNVQTFYKTSSDPIQYNLSESIKKLINGGVSMLNFFGHAAGIGFDISIDNPSEYNNYGKYPFLIANSCFAGDIFQPNVGVVNSSEAFILIRDKGAIAYLGSVTPGTPAYLNLYTNSFFKHYCSKSYGKSLGLVINNSIESIYSTYPQIKEIILEMVLHGDPALVVNSEDIPDYAISQSSFFTSPEIITTEYDSFAVNIIVSNIGKAVSDSIVYEIERTLPDNKTKQKFSKLKRATYYIDTLVFWVPINKFDDLGKNHLTVRVDALSQVTEKDETNNEFTYTFEIKAADLKPVYPAEFAIYTSQNLTLKASTFYPLSEMRSYIFQIDTTIYFNSPLFEEIKVNSAGGVVEAVVNQMLMDSIVYYWRVSLDSVAKGGFNWRNSSFQYIPTTTGWSQSHFFQFKNNEYRLAVYNEPQRKFEYVNEVKVIKCINGIIPYIPWTEPQYIINGSQQSYTQCTSNGMKIAVIDPVSGEPWINHYLGSVFAEYGSYTCRNYPIPTFEFATVDFPSGVDEVKDSAWFQRMADFLSIIPDGYYVLARSAQNSNITKWPEYLYKAYDSIGANFHRGIPDNRPYIIWGTKGQLGGAREIIGDSIQAIIQMVDSFNTRWTEGYIATPVIGPTEKWNSLSWKTSSQETYNSDVVNLSVIGIKNDGTEDTLIYHLPTDSSFVNKLNDRMPAILYPYCKIVVYMKDDSMHTPPNINHLRVCFSDVPELAVDPKVEYKFHSDTLQRGDTMKIKIAYRNISSVDLNDSLLVKYWVQDKDFVSHELGYRKLSSIQANSSIIDTFSMATINLTGNCYFYVEINPLDTLTKTYLQLETTHSNNSLEVPFFVFEDNSNPLLDVTFDGIHILNNDIVSARPEIIISLLDDNQYIAINDTSSFNVYVKAPGDLVRQRIYFTKNGVEQLQFVAAELPENKAKVIFMPEFIKDGEYILYVQASDNALNLSGTDDYQIQFNVVNKSTITNLLNWPNPFTTKTHFVFTLTGSKIPDYMLIQIMTISGKIVREIHMNELGPIHIGRNITEYAWDGTDDFGDRLANGIYLYRVITKINNEDIEHRETSTDTYFKNNFGKMYLMR